METPLNLVEPLADHVTSEFQGQIFDFRLAALFYGLQTYWIDIVCKLKKFLLIQGLD